MKTDSMIFDLDGTLWSAMDACIMAWNKALERIGVKDFTVTHDKAKFYAGKLLEDIFIEYFSFLPADKHRELGLVYAEEEKLHMKKYGGRLYPGTREALANLNSNYKLFIVSNCLEGYIENFLYLHKLQPFFTDHECSGNTGKPKSENIALIINRNALKSPVYVGDTTGDFDASTKNNIPFIYAAFGFGKVDGAAYSIDGLGEVEGVLGRLA